MSVRLDHAHLESRRGASGTVVEFVSFADLRGEEVEDIGKHLGRVIEEQRPRTLLLDFTGVEYLTAAALSKLILLNRRLGFLGVRFVLSNLSAQLCEVFTITQLDRVLDIRPAREAVEVPG